MTARLRLRSTPVVRVDINISNFILPVFALYKSQIPIVLQYITSPKKTRGSNEISRESVLLKLVSHTWIGTVSYNQLRKSIG